MRERQGFTERRFIRYAWQGALLGLLVTGAVMIATIGPDTRRQLAEVRWGLLSLVCLPVLGAWCCFAGRVRLTAGALGHAVSYRNALKIALSTEFGCAASPAGLGGAVVRLALLRACGIPVALGATMVAADALLDIAFFLTLAPFAVMVLWRDPEWAASLARAPAVEWWLLVLVLAAPAALVIALVARRGSWQCDAEWLASHLPGSARFRLSSRVRRVSGRIRSEWARTKASARFLYRQRRSVLVVNFGLTCLQWCCRYGVLPLVLLSFAGHRNPLPLMLVQAILFGVSFLLVIPGGGGVVELLSIAILPLFVSGPVIGVVLLLWRFFSYYLQLLAGGAVFLWTVRHLDRMKGPATGYAGRVEEWKNGRVEEIPDRSRGPLRGGGRECSVRGTASE